jgi:hypothetical protein
MTSPLRRVAAGLAIAVTTAGVLAGLAQPAQAESHPHKQSTIRYEEHHDHSATLASMPAAPLRSEQGENEPIRQMPNRGSGVHTDPVVQTTMA